MLAFTENRLMVAKELNMHESTKPHVKCQVPANVVRVVINYHLVAVPGPIVTVSVVRSGNAEIEAAEPEAVASSASQMPNVAAANSACKAPMLPRVIEVVAGVSTARIVANPFAVVVDVGSFGVSGGIGIMMFLRAGWSVSRTIGLAGTMLGNTVFTRITPVFFAFALTMLGPGTNGKHQQYGQNSKHPFHVSPLQTLPVMRCNSRELNPVWRREAIFPFFALPARFVKPQLSLAEVRENGKVAFWE